ncbi:hypothetical protein RHMOL_Rhmol06G0143400 [Rhododendron molle]|uniref:Uncharacterized protein n=1 Tax=Rhododendron molle TaxID=49168 RepID=A0ACC0NE53_RHOML|nr:hypothetical protein RHMOL_Rhmol06G0143400 [Rhododendron molle]
MILVSLSRTCTYAEDKRGPAADPTGHGTGFQIFDNTLTGNTVNRSYLSSSNYALLFMPRVTQSIGKKGKSQGILRLNRFKEGLSRSCRLISFSTRLSASVGIRACTRFQIMARQEVRDGHYVVAKDVNEGDDATQGAQLGVWFQQIKDMHKALVKWAALIIDNQPHCYLLNSCSFMEEATVRWPFTSKVILDPVVDWNKPPLFDEEIEIFQVKEAL